MVFCQNLLIRLITPFNNSNSKANGLIGKTLEGRFGDQVIFYNYKEILSGHKFLKYDSEVIIGSQAVYKNKGAFQYTVVPRVVDHGAVLRQKKWIPFKNLPNEK